MTPFTDWFRNVSKRGQNIASLDAAPQQPFEFSFLQPPSYCLGLGASEALASAAKAKEVPKSQILMQYLYLFSFIKIFICVSLCVCVCVCISFLNVCYCGKIHMIKTYYFNHIQLYSSVALNTFTLLVDSPPHHPSPEFFTFLNRNSVPIKH